jgi:hypothetical protein
MNSESFSALSVIDWVFFLLSATVVWQLRLPAFFAALARNIGARSGSPIFHLLVDIFPPIILVSAAWLTTEVYKKVIWPRLPSSNYRHGWWIYGLIAYGEDGEEPTTVAGHFYLDQTPESVRIPEGKAYIVEDDEVVEERGTWQSETIWLSEDSVKIIFNMKAVDETGLPESYQGLIDLSRTLDDASVGDSSYEGQFFDLDRGNMVLGQIHAERMGPKESYDRDEIRQQLRENVSLLINRSDFDRLS